MLREASRPGPDGLVLAPALAGVRAGRVVTRRVGGARLDRRLLAGPVDGEVLRRSGGLLAALHARTAPTVRLALIETPPWEPVPFSDWLASSPGQRRLLGRLHSDAPARAAGRRVVSELYSGSCWLHGDARADNVCIEREHPLLVDWDRSGLGRAEADLGALLASVLVVVLAGTRPASLTAGQQDVPDQDGGLGDRLLAARDAACQVLSGYREAAPVAPDRGLLGAAVGSALVTQAWTRTAAGAMGRTTLTALEMGLNFLVQPERWALIDAV